MTSVANSDRLLARTLRAKRKFTLATAAFLEELGSYLSCFSLPGQMNRAGAVTIFRKWRSVRLVYRELHLSASFCLAGALCSLSVLPAMNFRTLQ